jgi:hypothetical protein
VTWRVPEPELFSAEAKKALPCSRPWGKGRTGREENETKRRETNGNGWQRADYALKSLNHLNRKAKGKSNTRDFTNEAEHTSRHRWSDTEGRVKLRKGGDGHADSPKEDVGTARPNITVL